MTITRRALLQAALASPLALPAPLVFAQGAWPQRPVRLVVPFAAGGPSDVLARAFAKQLGEAVGQPVVIDNRTGAGGSIGIDAVAKAAPDGYTLGFAHTGTTAINPHVMQRNPYDPLTDLAPITPIVSYANVLVVNANVPASTVQEFVQWAKANPTAATFASGGNGATNHLSGELLKTLTGAPLVHVPYKGNSPAMTDVIAGNVASMFDIPVTVLPQLKTGRIRALAILSSRRSSVLPDVPTLREAGYPGFEEAGSDLWFGLVAPAQAPAALVERIHAETVKVVRSRDMAETIKTMGYEPWTMQPAEFKAFIRADHAKWGKVVKASGLKAE
ncbi:MULTISPECIES: Bug family tripartite tricarboxylate transporter substrate binding protein [Ramlibacter]|uniref:Tripartite tricarboxylate transporter substrate binding protein n=1 Tax=Ramlibacter pinisoli TaxID=2682844 RepID=A0A6N8J092_9BURK|nr:MULTISPECIES: tripartite tricarboxylate transporter substrate binding protein [Ramlibacter]MBA2962290.1 tripartite tricarboxylate transporter substrate binding protein [Ramlibacter sp. CGMCC 1.13660]MVQ32232.1 tripartite tricarboxylate transporter substrate binding protein [Ramlibacter pinisoli]